MDYAGPIFIKNSILRNRKTVKSYICLFVCFSTKAVHIELVCDLSTNSFLNAFKRFVSRRGKPADIFSDNGSNFRGAHNELKELYTFLDNNEGRDKISNFLVKDKIKWHFIPANSPHMGGLWEAAIKSTKYHLKRILSKSVLSYDELYTVLVQIEACLNSRPLSSLSDDPSDPTPLTPSHFLIGESLAALPHKDVPEVQMNRLTRYEYIQKLFQHFWKRWSQDYISSLQTRNKWKKTQPCLLKPGALVLLRDETCPPLHWPLARVTELHPGQDGVVRVVSLKLSNGSVLKRSIAKICVLPLE